MRFAPFQPDYRTDGDGGMFSYALISARYPEVLQVAIDLGWDVYVQSNFSNASWPTWVAVKAMLLATATVKEPTSV
jgi:hypothetical protein